MLSRLGNWGTPALGYPVGLKKALMQPVVRFGQESGNASEAASDENPLKKRMLAAMQAAQRAGDIILKYFNNPALTISEKSPSELVTNADHEADHAIQETLKAEFPADDYLTEESFKPDQKVDMKSAWIIDPLDATRNFANQIPHFAVSIAYVKDGKPTVGVIYDPVKQEMFTAISGEEAKLNGQPIKVNPNAEPEKTILSLCNPIPEKFATTMKKAAHRRMGCTALDMAYVASGRLGASCERNLKVWDIAAAIPMVETAGGQVSDFQGQPIDLNNKTKVNYVASNTKLHDKMLDLFKA